MISCDEGLIVMNGTERQVVAEFQTMAKGVYEHVLLPKYEVKEIANDELRNLIEEVIEECNKEDGDNE